MDTYKLLTIKKVIRQGEVCCHHERMEPVGMKGSDRKVGRWGQGGSEKNRVCATHVPGQGKEDDQ
ncbi:MAG: hypothetical protein D3925_01620 [Candidatus Electrothrix sp. AR5]|nr:hypothetical protein [Candidatus Electrothrix sp. AR5]